MAKLLPLHTTHRLVPGLPRSILYASRQQAESIVVLVHGVLPNGHRQWSSIPRVLQDNVRAQKTDILLFGYDWCAASLESMSDELVAGLSTILLDPQAFHASVAARGAAIRPATEYSRVVLVGYSLGAVVVRHAMLKAHAKKPTWLDRVELCLFAPAHRGYRSDSVHALIPRKLLNWKVVASIFCPALEFLQKDSMTLKSLESATLKAALTATGHWHRAGTVVFGRRERVVVTDRFGEDTPTEWVSDRGHLNILQAKGSSSVPASKILRLL